MQLNIHEKALIAAIFDPDDLSFTNHTSLIPVAIRGVASLDLIVLQRKLISQTFSGKTNTAFLRELRFLFLAAYATLWSQKDENVRQKIADFFAKQICEEFGATNIIYYPNLELFFRESLLQVKINDNVFKQFFMDSRCNKLMTLDNISSYLEGPAKLCLSNIFKADSKLRPPAEKISQKNFISLRKWATDYPYEIFLDKAAAEKELQDYGYSINYMLISSILLYAILAAHEEDYALLKTVIYSLLALSVWGTTLNLSRLAAEESSIMKNIHFNLVDVEDEKAITPLKKSPKLFARPILTIQVQQTEPTVWQDTIDAGEEVYTPTVKKEKVKTRPLIALEASQETVVTDKASPVALVNPEYFGEVFKDLLPIFIVLIDKDNLGRNNSYFAIWDKCSIESSVKNEGDEGNCKALFEIFKQGKVASKRNDNGFKFLSSLGFFEIKKALMEARIFGEREVVEKGKKAIIFEHYSRAGLH